MDEASVIARLTNGGIRPLFPFRESLRQATLDAAALLQVRRSEVAAQVSAGGRSGAEVIGVGMPAVNEWMARESMQWHEYRSTRRGGVVENLRLSLPLNRIRAEAGARITTLYDYFGLDANARLLIANETLGTYLFGVAPVQMTLVGHRFVLLQGPEVDGEMSVMKVTLPACLEAAERYWEVALRSTVTVETVSPLVALSPRQRQVVALLSEGYGDDAIAGALGVSVRTVRSDVAAVLDALGVRSRFAAGVRLTIWDKDDGDRDGSP